MPRLIERGPTPISGTERHAIAALLVAPSHAHVHVLGWTREIYELLLLLPSISESLSGIIAGIDSELHSIWDSGASECSSCPEMKAAAGKQSLWIYVA